MVFSCVATIHLFGFKAATIVQTTAIIDDVRLKHNVIAQKKHYQN